MKALLVILLGLAGTVGLLTLALGAAVTWLTQPATSPDVALDEEPPVFVRPIDTHRCAWCREPRTESDLMRLGDSYVCREGCDDGRAA